MRYLLLIYGNEQAWTSLTPEAAAAMMAGYGKYTQDLIDGGVMRAGDELQPTFTATTVRLRDGKTHTTDGPFAETKEQLGGYYIIETESLDEAVKWAAQCPGAEMGSVEIRPVVTHSAEGHAPDAATAGASARG